MLRQESKKGEKDNTTIQPSDMAHRLKALGIQISLLVMEVSFEGKNGLHILNALQQMKARDLLPPSMLIDQAKMKHSVLSEASVFKILAYPNPHQWVSNLILQYEVVGTSLNNDFLIDLFLIPPEANFLEGIPDIVLLLREEGIAANDCQADIYWAFLAGTIHLFIEKNKKDIAEQITKHELLPLPLSYYECVFSFFYAMKPEPAASVNLKKDQVLRSFSVSS